MLPFVLVLFVATSALAAPSVQLNIIPISEAVPPKHNGRSVSGYYINQASELTDGGSTPPYVLTAKDITIDMADHSDRGTQALALGQIIGLLGPLSTGIPGDACAAAEVIDAYVRAVRSGNHAAIRSAVAKFIQSVSSTIDQLVQLSSNPNALRFATGPRGSCSAGGRTYQFEAAWDYILSNASPASAELVNEQYCAAKRLYNAFDSLSNNVGAFITAVSLPPVNSAFKDAFEHVASFVSALPSPKAAATAAAGAKLALARSVQNL